MNRRTEALRIGLLIDGEEVPIWIRDIVEAISADARFQIVCVVANDNPPVRNSFLTRLIANHDLILYKLYSLVDDFLFSRPDDPFQVSSLGDLIGGIDKIVVRPRRRKFSDEIQRGDVAKIKSYKPDVLIRFGFRILKGEILSLSTFGVCSYHHGDNLVNRGGPAGFWEVMNGDPITGTIIQILGGDLDSGKVVKRAYAPTQNFSVRKNRNNLYWKVTPYLVQELGYLYEHGSWRLDEVGQHPQFYSHRIYKRPGNYEMAKLIFRLAGRILKHFLAKIFFREQWTVLFAFNNRSGPVLSACRYNEIPKNKKTYTADPFPVKKDGLFYVFLEEFEYKKNKGRISVSVIDGDQEASPPSPVLEEDFHLSYPFIFEWQQKFYLIPESAQTREVRIYESQKFPFEWRLKTSLFQGENLVDLTIHEHKEIFWLFCSKAYKSALNRDELYLYYSATPWGPWQPHPQNPVKSDVRSARPAGRLFNYNGKLYRPAQDCSRRYGYGVVLNEILEISQDNYSEKVVTELTPSWAANILATHTFNYSQELSLIDALVRVGR